MKKFSDPFTQGGQTKLHDLHMMRQVISSTLKISMLLALLAFALLLFWQHSWQDYYLWAAFYKARVRVYLDFLPRGFLDTTWLVADDLWLKSYDYYIVANPKYLKFLQHMQAHVLKVLQLSFLVFIAIFVIICGFWVYRGKKRQQTTVLNGYTLSTPAALKKQIAKCGASTIHIAGISLPKNAECEHMMLCGTTGSGKTNAINHLLAQIRALNQKAIIIDSTGGFVSSFFDQRQDKLLNPFDARTQQWDLWQECREEYDFDEFAQSLIPNNKYDSFWTKAGQQLFSTAALNLRQDPTRNIDLLLNSLLTKPLAEVFKEYKDTYVASYLDPAIEKTALGVRATLVSALKNLKYLESKGSIVQPELKFSIRKWLEEPGPGWLFLSSMPTQREILKPLMSAWLSIAVKSLMAMGEDHNRRVWFIIDELACLNYIPILAQGLAEVRKYGGCVVLSFQDLHQLDAIYGPHVAKTLGSLTGTKLIFRLDSYASSQISAIFGEQEVLESQESISFGAHQMRDGVSLSAQQHTRSLISSADIMQLDNLQAFLKFPRNLPATKVKFKLFAPESMAAAFVPKAGVEKEDAPLEAGVVQNKAELEVGPI